MYLVSRNNRGLLKSEDYECILDLMATLKEIDVYDLRTLIKHETELKNEIKYICKEKDGTIIKIINLDSDSSYYRKIMDDKFEN